LRCPFGCIVAVIWQSLPFTDWRQSDLRSRPARHYSPRMAALPQPVLNLDSQMLAGQRPSQDKQAQTSKTDNRCLASVKRDTANAGCAGSPLCVWERAKQGSSHATSGEGTDAGPGLPRCRIASRRKLFPQPIQRVTWSRRTLSAPIEETMHEKRIGGHARASSNRSTSCKSL
jgi:hypothetical protein